MPAATSDGRTIVFEATESRDRAGLWKVDPDGSHAVRLVAGESWSPVVTPDDWSVIFLSMRSGVKSPWMVSLGGGPPIQIVNSFAASPSLDVSPDGKALIFGSPDEQGRQKVVVCDLPACQSRRSLSIKGGLLRGRRLPWTP